MIFHQKFAQSQNFQPPTQCVVGDIGKNFRKIIDGPSTLKIEKNPKLFVYRNQRKKVPAYSRVYRYRCHDSRNEHFFGIKSEMYHFDATLFGVPSVF